MKQRAIPTRRMVWLVAQAGLLIAAAALSGCAEPDYRNVVYSNGQGGIEVQRVAKPPAPPAPPSPAPIEAAPQPPLDPDLAQIEQLWPTLSPEDRKTVLDLTHRLSSKP